jgi:hypothetical protein
MQGIFELSTIGQHVGLDLWNYKTQGIAANPLLRAALDYILPYAFKKQIWPYPQIASPINTKSLSDLLCQAIILFSKKQPSVYTSIQIFEYQKRHCYEHRQFDLYV